MKSEIVVLMFADIVGSTRLYEQQGDQRAREIVADAIAQMSQVVKVHQGAVLQELGDEIACRFPDTESAAAAACAIHAKMHEDVADIGDTSIMPQTRIRIGLHRGTIVSGEDILSGETAKVARWAANNAKGDQTLATRAVIDDLPEMYRSVSRFVDDETWNFVSLEHIEIFEIIWDVEAITACPGEVPPTPATSYREVVLNHSSNRLVLSETQPVVSVGRDIQNDLVIREDLVSRHHLSAQFSRGRCTVTDNSTNGTFVIIEDEQPVAVRRETYPLQRSGIIFLGEPSEEKTPIHFSCT